MIVNLTNKNYKANKIKQYRETAEFARKMDVTSASPETLEAVITDLVRIVEDYCVDLEKTMNTKESEVK